MNYVFPTYKAVETWLMMPTDGTWQLPFGALVLLAVVAIVGTAIEKIWKKIFS